jgi:hypothetical protein
VAKSPLVEKWPLVSSPLVEKSPFVEKSPLVAHSERPNFSSPWAHKNLLQRFGEKVIVVESDIPA